MNFYQNEKIIKRACELNSQINDTLIISGILTGCMEYSSFNLIEIDSCNSEFNMELDLNNIEFTDKLYDKFAKIDDCAAESKMILKGVLQKEKNKEYGHLGSNNSEFKVLKIIYFGKVKIKKLKTE
jgi:hypothetical protein